MNKTSFEKEISRINVPKKSVVQAIHQGIRDAGNLDGASRKKHKKIVSGLISAGIVAALIIFSFLSPSVSRVLADVPILSAIYGRAYDSIGQNLSNQKLVTELNKSAEDNGIKLTITSAYYDGAVIGLTFKASGPIKVDDYGEQGKNFRAFYEVFGGDPNIDDSKELAQTSVKGNDYTGHVQLNYPKVNLPEDATLPITFKEIGNQKGNWKFDVPIKQLPTEKTQVSAESQSKDGRVKVRYNSIVFGKSSTVINYQVILPNGDKFDQIGIEDIYNDQGTSVRLLSDGDYGTTIKGDKQIISKRLVIPSSVKNHTETLTIQPVNRIREKDQFVSLNEQFPRVVKAERSDLAVNVENVSFNNGRITLNYQINLGEKKNDKGFYFIKDTAKNDILIVKKSEKNIYQKPLRHSVTVLDKNNLRFSSTFDIGTDHPKNYVLRVSLGGLSINLPDELRTATLSLKE